MSNTALLSPPASTRHLHAVEDIVPAARPAARSVPAGTAPRGFALYVGIDEKINRLHQYLKVLKFGYGRATDHACEDIRNGRLTRAEYGDSRTFRRADSNRDGRISYQEFLDSRAR